MWKLSYKDGDTIHSKEFKRKMDATAHAKLLHRAGIVSITTIEKKVRGVWVRNSILIIVQD